MKASIRFAGALLLLLCAGMTSCNNLFSEKTSGAGALVLSFDSSASLLTRSGYLPDVGSFLITISNSSGTRVYEGRYADSPERFELPAGSYLVTASSCVFEEPCYDKAQFGDSRLVSVTADKETSVILQCKQLNCGLELLADASFRAAFPDAEIMIRSSGGNLLWTPDEKRTGYFNPGIVTLVMNGTDGDECLCSRMLDAGSMLKLKLSASEQLVSGSGSGIVLQLDTSRVWSYEEFVLGGENPGSDKSNAYTTLTARDHIGEKDVWVEGYIIGVATSTSKMSLTPPFSKNTNILLGLRSSTVNPDYVLSVELALGDVRDALNLMDNPSNRGHRVLLKGDLVGAYYGFPGIKGITEFELD